jgi:Fe(3+) dicitrate transport protein
VFTLGVKGNHATLEISRTGYEYKTLRVEKMNGQFGEIDIELREEIKELKSVTVYGGSDRHYQVQRLNDEAGTYLIAGKKNEVVNISNADANIAQKTGRQIFSRIPGVFVYDMDGSGNQVNIATRGLDPHRSWEFNIRQNGILTNTDMYGYPASHYNPPMESIERVELIRGTAALQYGAQFGGLLNYITKSPDSSKPMGFENLTTVGSYGLFSMYNAIGGKHNKWSYYAYYGKRVSDGYRKNSQSDASGELLSIQYQPTDKLLLKAEFTHSVYLYHIPGPLDDSMFYADPRQSTRARNYYSPDIYVPSLSAEWKLNRNTLLQFTTSAVLGNRSSVQYIGFADNKDTINAITNDYKNRQVDIDHFKSFTTELRLRHEYEIGNMKSVLASGVQIMHNNLHRTQQGVGTTGSDYDLTLVIPKWGRDLHYKTNNLAVFAENIFYITPAFTVSPGFRYEKGETKMTGNIFYYNSEKIPLSIKHDFPLFGLSTQYKVDLNNRCYAGISQAYRPMVFKDVVPASSIEVIDPNLKDASGYNAEAGFNGKWRSILNYELTYFHILYKDRIGGVILQDPNGNYYNYKTNIGTSVTDGIELYAEATPIRRRNNFSVSVFTSTSWMIARYTKGTVSVNNENVDISGNKLESAPEWITRNGIHILYRTISASIQYSYLSKSFSDAFNTPMPVPNGSKGPVPGYGLWDFDISSRLFKNYQLKFGVNNISDKQYFTKRPTFYPDPGIWPSDGRSWYVSFGCKF